MRNILLKWHRLPLMIIAALLVSSFVKPVPPKPVSDDLEGTISISGAFALYPITVKWAGEFKKLHHLCNKRCGGANI